MLITEVRFLTQPLDQWHFVHFAIRLPVGAKTHYWCPNSAGRLFRAGHLGEINDETVHHLRGNHRFGAYLEEQPGSANHRFGTDRARA